MSCWQRKPRDDEQARGQRGERGDNGDLSKVFAPAGCGDDVCIAISQQLGLARFPEVVCRVCGECFAESEQRGQFALEFGRSGEFLLELLAFAAVQFAKGVSGDVFGFHGRASAFSRFQAVFKVWMALWSWTPTFETLIRSASPISL